MPHVNVRVVGGKPRTLEVPSDLTAGELHELVWGEVGRRNLKLVLKGRCLEVGDAVLSLRDGDTVIAMAPRGAPPKHVSSMSDPEPSPEDEELKFRLHPDASPLQRRLTEILQQRLHVPDIVLLILFSVRPRVWAMLVLWFALSPVMARMDLGPVYILGTLFAVMLCNLGQRKEGEASAYTWFNNFQPLPGNLNADMIDNQLRRGQM